MKQIGHLNDTIINHMQQMKGTCSSSSKFLLCPNCKENIPDLQIESSPSKEILINITCKCQKESNKMPIKSFLSKAKEASSRANICCISHSKPSTLYCIECSYWLCNDCIYLHQLCQGKSGKDHLITSTAINIICKLHQAKFQYYCKECCINICTQCRIIHNHTHVIIPLEKDIIALLYNNLFSIQEIIEKNDAFYTAFQSRIDEENFENIAYPSDIKIMSEEMCNAFKFNKTANEDLKEFYYLYYKTAMTLMNYPCYELMRLYTTLHINPKEPKEDPRNIYKAFKSYQNHFLLNQAVVQMKQYECISTLKSHNKCVNCMVKLDNGLIASGSMDSTMKIWSIKENLKLKMTLLGKKSHSIESIIQLSNGIVFTSTVNGEHLFYDMSNYSILNRSNKFYEKTMRFSSPMLQLSNEQLVTRNSDDIHVENVIVWRNHSDYYTLKGHTNRINHLIELNNGNLLSVSHDNSMRIWGEYFGGYQLNSYFKAGKCAIKCIIKLINGKLVSNHDYNYIKIYNYPVMNTLGMLNGHTGMVCVLLEMANGWLASGSRDKCIKMWDVEKMNCIMTLTGHSKSVTCLLQVNDRMLLSGSEDATIKVWNLM